MFYIWKRNIVIRLFEERVWKMNVFCKDLLFVILFGILCIMVLKSDSEYVKSWDYNYFEYCNMFLG